MMAFLSLQNEIRAHALSVLPEESCGLIVNNKYIPCKNYHSSPLSNFAISAKDYAKAERKGNIQAIVHSHPEGFTGFSKHDVVSCKQSNLPWLLYCLQSNEWHYVDPTGEAPLVGRPWVYGIYDCYAILKDYFQQAFAIELDDFPRGEEGEWESPDWRMFEKNFADQGFVPVNEAEKPGDFILMQLQAPFPNHAGVLVRPNENVFYHHLMGRFSEEAVYGGYWKKCTSQVLRHRSLM
jgi:proteasome lid subunit RPN8/RPN11